MIWRALTPYLLAASVGGFGLWWVMDLRADNTALRAENASLVREAEVAKGVAAQAKLARDVAAANAERLLVAAREYQNLKDTLKGVGDEPLPDWFRGYLGRLFPAPPR